ncbi:MAG: hypothetical protein ACRDA8_13025 [Shewanella sp.]
MSGDEKRYLESLTRFDPAERAEQGLLEITLTVADSQYHKTPINILIATVAPG